MLEEIAKRFLDEGILGWILVASWIILGSAVLLLWRVWRADDKEWAEERNALYKEARIQDKERFQEMLTTIQHVQVTLTELKVIVQQLL
jgi:predicted negative regulator of RcsB-dependent stress response